MSLIGTGTQLRNRAMQGLQAVSKLETQTQIANDSLDAQKKAQETQMLGTGAGIGGAIGVNKALAAKKAAGAAAKSSKAGGLLYQPGGLEYAAGMGPAPSATAGVGQVAEMTKALNDTTQAVNTINAGGTVAAEGVVGSKVAAGSSSGLMSGLGAIAGPLAIGIGAAFLLNKLFG